eukprot:TRINITY_DN1561_c0_g1_i7.p2 TRINITY_DN1561_c0_g1~~TRINITY_DN1561_c0_g1_i7.p2  ORF type:complete len:252 (+),score=72.38 TRINITY_DN1561_c0_g1_i7:145-900(+)
MPQNQCAAELDAAAARAEVEALAEPVGVLLSNLVCATEARLQELGAAGELPARHPLTATFVAKRVPGVSIDEYFARLAHYAGLSLSSTVVALILVDRMTERNVTFAVTSGNVHRVLLAALVLSLKYLEDGFYSNAYYARVGGVPVSELNSLEVSALSLLQFDLYVSEETFASYLNAVVSAAEYRKRQREEAATREAALREYIQQQEAAAMAIKQASFSRQPIADCAMEWFAPVIPVCGSFCNAAGLPPSLR